MLQFYVSEILRMNLLCILHKKMHKKINDRSTFSIENFTSEIWSTFPIENFTSDSVQHFTYIYRKFGQILIFFLNNFLFAETPMLFICMQMMINVFKNCFFFTSNTPPQTTSSSSSCSLLLQLLLLQVHSR